ncbi:MAG: Re/Si-specific NAD(P)(+) transhydrogenase subunit alpha [Gammaproteobacteria bacterium]|nr:Re/Si-specific NAD(P)(+) transhydrogenase subunit alpha [Gammaproteobacteria bacterium]MCP4091740.1 Re/Si-specific NAD(P)(+) transhydrogenase subunit alpha [Gammaproteobacteria bacterium]MCP4275047.1 Re/Si-specific NAD(P)(+) transhydrogenase subunit alpha [Gammaproteobacteria bacterium]MCP4831871.1 Re/Si-specific NAD(P)(+) transhydrogenase subunit alpha [Gammaproteobacteria bacterium]MCP4929806.1 Re/Si-specific NAD(P)(+) transhydrogenase subunit alpha [Gammaproteobacteria bacterium]
MPVTIGVLKETTAGETRVAIVPEVINKFIDLGAQLLIETGAGEEARIPDALYEGAEFSPNPQGILSRCDILLKVQPPTPEEIAALRPEAIVIGFMQAYKQQQMARELCAKKITSFAMELVPRISRAQSMDALSSQAAVAGYKAVLIAANTLDKFVPMLTTAAGTIRPSQFLVIGAGVAGLQAIATAKRLGAIVEGFDVRSATREQVESLGARFVDTGISAEGEGGYARELTAEEQTGQQAVLDEHIAKADVVITTAAVPGRPAPRIINLAAVEGMKPGAVIVDLAAESGGNCELTQPGETITHKDIRIIGPVNLPAELARHASEMYARNLLNFIQPAISDGMLTIDWEDEVFTGAVLTRDGEIAHEQTRDAIAKGESS